ncbi:FkbM family methyltransferase [Nocardioides sp. KC13]|uniref:FkbM family methyltransferase n=1 Tax=Nocardioides turkmenicus TaxID=2711220 RepID=A0A6M1QZ90_9ACTN|nr:FkbM family methyltransferase [Nocardioides sp. KC13]NGN93136.1 FkbM family methyltransferase [Nocardioides sp. KC13]
MAYATTEQGHRIYVKPTDPRALGLIANKGRIIRGSLELWQVALGLHAWQTVIDIGVNYGEMLVGVDIPADAELIGFEPNTSLHKVLRKTLAARGVSIDLRSQAVSDRPGTARFAVDRTWSGTSSLYDERHDGSARWQLRDVEVTTLDEVLGGSGRSFCVKVDVEGFEREVVDGAARSLESTEHWALMLEIEHMDRGYLAELARTRDVFVKEKDSGALRRVPGERIAVEEMLDDPTLHRQDCLVLSPALLR